MKGQKENKNQSSFRPILNYFQVLANIVKEKTRGNPKYNFLALKKEKKPQLDINNTNFKSL